jgi:hypothetical protein
MGIMLAIVLMALGLAELLWPAGFGASMELLRSILSRCLIMKNY